MNLNDAISLTNAVRDFEKIDTQSNPAEYSEAARDLVSYINSYIYSMSLSGGWERQLRQFIDKKEPPASEAYEKDGDLYVGRWRVHLVYDGEIDGHGDIFTGWRTNRAQGLPVVEFYDLTANPEIFPMGQISSGQCMSDMLSMGPYASPSDSIENKNVIYLGYPEVPLRGEALKVVAEFICKKRDEIFKARAEKRAYRELLRKDPYIVENGQRTIFDASLYHGQNGLDMAFKECVDDLVYSEGLPEFSKAEAENEIRSSMSEDDLLEYAKMLEESSLDEETSDINRFLSASRDNPNRGQYLITRETTCQGGRETTRFNIYSGMDTLLKGFPAKGNETSELQNCKVVKIWDEDGRLFIRGVNSTGGTMDVEIRQTTYEADLLRSAPEDLWNDRQYAVPPRYASLALGGYPNNENPGSFEGDMAVVGLEELVSERSSVARAINGPTIPTSHHAEQSTQSISESAR